MATIEKIKEGLFCITWIKQHGGQSSSQIKVNLPEVFESCQLAYRVTGGTNLSASAYAYRMQGLDLGYNGIPTGTTGRPNLEGTLEIEIVFSEAIMKPCDFEEVSILASQGCGLQEMNQTMEQHFVTRLRHFMGTAQNKSSRRDGTQKKPPSGGNAQTQAQTWTTTFLPSNHTIMISGQHSNVFEIVIDLTHSVVSLKKEKNKESKYVLDHLLNLWTNKTLADVSFKCKERSIKAHTLIVASGSPIMAAMFNDFKENRERVVEIEEIEGDVFERLLRYIYTGETDFAIGNADKLLVAADMYAIDSLKEECASHLSQNISIENAARFLVLAHLHNASGLYEATLSFMSKNGKAICSRKDWMEIIKSYPELSFAAMQRMVL